MGNERLINLLIFNKIVNNYQTLNCIEIRINNPIVYFTILNIIFLAFAIIFYAYNTK